MSRVFTPRAVTALEPMIREVISGYLDPLDDADEFDVVADFSAPFPVEIISRMLGVPEGERQQIRHWLDLSLHREPGEMDPTPEGAAGHARDGRLLLRAGRREARATRPTTCSRRLTQVTVDRGDGVETGLDDDEIAGFATLLGGAGAETVTKLVGNAVVLFAAHPDQWQQGRRRPDADPARGRGDPPLPAAVAVPGPVLGRGPRVRGRHDPRRLPGAAAHRRRHPRPAGRSSAPTTSTSTGRRGVAIGFGHGVHSCLGAALARMESRIAIEELAARWQRLEVDEAGLRRVHMSNVAGYANVPVTAVR